MKPKYTEEMPRDLSLEIGSFPTPSVIAFMPHNKLSK